MINTLLSFTSGSLFNAASALLTRLHIKFDSETAEPINFSELYEQPIPKYLDEALACVDKTYFIGIVNDGSLSGNSTGDTLSSVAETMAHGGKYDGMFVFACDVRPSANLTRSAASALTRAFNRIASANPVILILRQGQYISLATCERMNYTQEWRNGLGEKLGKVCILRNVNCLAPHRGHIDILESLGDKAYPTFEELYKHWMEVFSSELLTRKFYNELSDWYAWAVMVAKFPNDLRTTEDDAKFNHESCIRLITRLIFVWFLKQKHLIPEEFFDEKYIRENLIEDFNPHDRQNLMYNAEESKYYRLILQNLFFAMLNCPIVAEGKTTPNNRRFMRESFQGKNPDYGINNIMRYKKEFMEGGADKFLKFANSCVPFLNGGLFDCLDNKDSLMFFDGFSEEKRSLEQLSLPDYLFFGDEVGKGIDLSQWYDDKKKKNVSARGIIDILKRYSFTIEENTPYDQEVSLDPELLGKVFENLLAAYNPETKQSARKQTGSFYTPREIVQYMVDESLVAHLKRMCGNEMEPQYRQLLNYAADEVSLTEDQRKSIMQALYHCRVLDPACGSGAFPMGILQQMVHVLKRIDPTNKMWEEMIVDIAIQEARKELEKVASGSDAEKAKVEENRKARLDDIENAFNQSINDPDYARKLYLIENCIYGVDIQPIATQISKLRFFISLVVDQKPTTVARDNFGIRPLPNLEAKFVTANTLIPLDRTQNLFTITDEIRYYEELLHDINHRIFLAKRNKEKQALREMMTNTRISMAQAMENMGAVSPNGYKQLMEWNMFDQNASASFFDPEWMFGIKDGFDIVIGNPPYVQLQDDKGKLANLYEPCGYITFAKTSDIYCLFYERGWQCIKTGGHLCFITSNKWLRASYGEKTRGFLASNANPKLLIDFTGIKVFESATVDTNILLLGKERNENATVCCVTRKIDSDSVNNLSLFVQQNSSVNSFEDSNSWVILTSIEQSIKKKIESVGTPLREWNIDIYRGVLTGYNDAFVVNTDVRNQILELCLTEDERSRTEELIRPLLRGRDISRYGYKWANLWLIATFPSRHYDISQYPSVRNYLLSFGIERLEQTGQSHLINGTTIKARKKTRNKWFELQDSTSYWEEFDKQKIVWASVGETSYSLVPEGYILLDTNYFFSSDTPFCLLAMLNSKLIRWWINSEDTPLGDGGAWRHYKYNLEKLCLPQLGNIFDQSIVDILNDKNETTRINYIDQKMFELFNLSEEEIIFIKEQM